MTNKTILIVDDQPDNVYLLQKQLEGNGFKTITAKHGIEGLKLLDENIVDMIISDVLMPEMDGFLFCRTCKKHRVFKKIPFLFYTASYLDKEDEKFGLALGAAKYIIKPVELDTLIKIIEDVFVHTKSQKKYVSKVTISEEEVLHSYSDRLINKLELKNHTLNAEISQRKKIETALIENESKFRSVYQNSNDAIAIIIDRKYVNCNKRTLELFGFDSEEEFINKKIGDLSPKTQLNGISSLKQLNIYFTNALKDEIQHYDWDLINKNGEIFQVEVVLSSFNLHGKKAILTTVRDISERKKVENKLKESEAFSKSILSSLSAHIAVIDKAGIVLAVNSAWEKFSLENDATKLERTSIGSNYIEVCKKAMANGDTLAEDVLKGIKAVFNKTTIGFNLEYPCHSPKEQRWFALHIEPFGDDSNKIVLSHSNISERKLAEFEKESTFTKLKEAQRMAKIGNWEFNPATKEIFFSDQLYYIFEIKNSVKNNLFKVYRNHCSQNDHTVLDNLTQKAIKTGQGYTYNYKITSSKGKTKYIQEICEVVKKTTELPLTLKGTIQDITKLKEAEQKLHQKNEELTKTNEELDRFVYSASHDLRAPLTSAGGLINILNTGLLPEQQEQKLQLDFIEQSLKKMDVFIGDILDYSKNKRITIAHNEINFKKLIDGIRSHLKYIDKDLKPEIKVEINQKSKFYSDLSRMEIMFNNLISNAIKYQDPIKKEWFVKIMVLTDDQKAIITIEDNGIGIGDEHKDKVFDMFYRATKLSTGSGMGMYIVKETIDRLKGTIALESTIHVGTKFILTLPNLK